MKQVFILVGDPQTGKSTLGRLIQQENVIVIDDLVISNASAKDVIFRLCLSNSDYAVLITKDEHKLNLLTDRLKEFTKISVLFVKKVKKNTNRKR